MAIKDILALLDSDPDVAGPYASSLASMFQAHLTAVSLVLDPPPSMAIPDASVDLLAPFLEKARAAAHERLEDFAARSRRLGITTEFDVIETPAGTTDLTIGPLARYFDLTIVRQPDPDTRDEREGMIEGALFGSGRPVLVVPYIQTPPLRLENVLIAWDGSATAARAVGDAMPLLVRANQIALVTAADGGEAGDETEMSARRMIRHLARHETVTKFHKLSKAGDVASTLLSYAFDSGADLIVMGGYGHSRFREVILGGATRGILKSMTVPVLMSH